MTARDRYTIKLECSCGNSGSADASELDGWSYKSGGADRQIDKIHGDFNWCASPDPRTYGDRFSCGKCGKEVR